MKIRRADIIIIVFFILASIFFYGIKRYSTDNNYYEKYIMIYSDNSLYKKIPIDNNSYNEVIPINNKFGRNIIRIMNGGVSVEDADCPDKICLKQGFINKSGQSIICLPHKLVIEIIGNTKEEKSSEIDGIAY